MDSPDPIPDPVAELEEHASDLKNHHEVGRKYSARYQNIDLERARHNGEVIGFFAIDNVDGQRPREVIRFDFYPTMSKNDWRVEVIGDFTFRESCFPGRSYESWLKHRSIILNHLDNFQTYLVDRVERQSLGVLTR